MGARESGTIHQLGPLRGSRPVEAASETEDAGAQRPAGVGAAGFRFEAIVDPCSRYQIWDNRSDLPVRHRDRLLSFALSRQAQRVAAFLNAAAG